MPLGERNVPMPPPRCRGGDDSPVPPDPPGKTSWRLPRETPGCRG